MTVDINNNNCEKEAKPASASSFSMRKEFDKTNSKPTKKVEPSEVDVSEESTREFPT